MIRRLLARLGYVPAADLRDLSRELKDCNVLVRLAAERIAHQRAEIQRLNNIAAAEEAYHAD